MNDENRETSIADHMRAVMSQLGEDVEREGLIKTPERVEKSLKFLTSGYSQSVDQVVNDAIFHESGDEMVLVQGIELYSLCEHHLLPFIGRCSVAYIPDGRILGLSKVARVIDVFARRLQVQERLTVQVAEAINRVLTPKGVGVIVEAKHLCMMMRGIQKQNSYATTSCMLGVFKNDHKTRGEFLSLAKRID